VKPFPIDVENRKSVGGFKAINRGINVFAGDSNCVSVPGGYNARKRCFLPSGAFYGNLLNILLRRMTNGKTYNTFYWTVGGFATEKIGPKGGKLGI
jgi:hypothetical protein